MHFSGRQFFFLGGGPRETERKGFGSKIISTARGKQARELPVLCDNVEVWGFWERPGRIDI